MHYLSTLTIRVLGNPLYVEGIKLSYFAGVLGLVCNCVLSLIVRPRPQPLGFLTRLTIGISTYCTLHSVPQQGECPQYVVY